MMERTPKTPEEHAKAILSLLFDDLDTLPSNPQQNTELSPVGGSLTLSQKIKDMLPESLQRLAPLGAESQQKEQQSIPFIPIIITIGVMTEHIAQLVKEGCERRGVQPQVVHITKQAAAPFQEQFSLKSDIYTDTVSAPAQIGSGKASTLPLQNLLDAANQTWQRLHLPPMENSRLVVITSSLTDESLQKEVILPNQSVVCNVFSQKTYAT
jgi:hypothetical protein